MVGGHVPLQLGEPPARVPGPRDRSEPVEPLVALAARLGEGGACPLVRALGGVSGGVQLGVFRVRLFGGPVGGGVERPPQCRAVVEPVGDPRELLGLAGQVGKVRAPPVGPGGELLSGAGGRAAAEPEPAGAVEHDPSGLPGGVPPAVPAGEQGVAELVCVSGDGRAAGLGPPVGLFRGGRSLLTGGLQACESAGVASLEYDDLPQRVGLQLPGGEPVQAALLGRPRRVQLAEHLLQRSGLGVAGGLGSGLFGGVGGAEIGAVAGEGGDPLRPRLLDVGGDEVAVLTSRPRVIPT